MKIKVHGSDNYIKFKSLFSVLSKVFFCEISDQFNSSEVNGHIIFSDNQQIILPEAPALVYLNNYVLDKNLVTDILIKTDLCGINLSDKKFSTKSFELKKTVMLNSNHEAIASQDDKCIWYRSVHHAIKYYYSLIPPCNLEVHQSLKDKFTSIDFIQVLPIIAFLNELVGASVIYPKSMVSIIIDDPNLHRTKYGYLDYKKLIEDSNIHGYHINFATIPLDLFYASKKAVNLLKKNGKHLSLIVHGNNHTSEELLVNSDQKSYSKLLMIKKRVDKYYQKYGISIGKVIIPPHGMMSRQFLKNIALFDFLGACISRPFPWYSSPSPSAIIDECENSSKMFPADFIEGTPIIPRMKVFEDIPFKLILHIPLVFYFHHDDFKHGINKFGEIVNLLNKYADVSWSSLNDIFHSNYIIKINSNKKAIAYLFSKQVIVHLPKDIDRISFKIINNIGNQRDMELWVDEEKIAMNYKIDNIYESLEISTKNRENLIVRFNCIDEKAMLNIPAEKTTIKAIIRRILTEFRDILAPVFPK